MSIITEILHSPHIFVFNSTNVSIEGSPFRITSLAAKEIIQKAPGTTDPPQPIEPIGKYLIVFN